MNTYALIFKLEIISNENKYKTPTINLLSSLTYKLTKKSTKRCFL